VFFHDHDREISRLQERHQSEIKHVASWSAAPPPQALPSPAGAAGGQVDAKTQMNYLELQRKLEEMELRHQGRELEMQRMLNATKKARAAELEGAGVKYEEMMAAKNNQIDAFRNELAAILGELRRLQEEKLLPQ